MVGSGFSLTSCTSLSKRGCETSATSEEMPGTQGRRPFLSLLVIGKVVEPQLHPEMVRGLITGLPIGLTLHSLEEQKGRSSQGGGQDAAMLFPPNQ